MGCGTLCEGCALQVTGAGFTEVEVGARYATNRLLIVGEASGEAEARESLPFRPHAQSGSLLADSLRACKIERSEVAITNVLRCHPPGDWLSNAPWEFSSISHCVPNYLNREIERLQPRAILALGGTAFRTLCEAPRGKYGTLDYCRGYVHKGLGAAQGLPVIPSYHPAFIRRGSPHLTPLLQRDLRRAFQIAAGRFKEPAFILDPFNHPSLTYRSPTLDEAWHFADTLNPDIPLIYDLETPLSARNDEDERTSSTDRDIKLFQCTQQRGSGIALPFREEFVEVIRRIIARSRLRVGFNNWNFDDPVLGANEIDVDDTDDAMVMFGYYWSDLPKNLQAAAQSCGFPFPWKHFNDIDEEFYGCGDADATLCVYDHMKALLEREGMWESYRRYFARLWPILRDMARRGIPIDNEKRRELHELITKEDQRVTIQVQALVPRELLSTKQKNGYKNPPQLVCADCGWKGRTDHQCQPPESNLATPISYTTLAEYHGLVLRDVIIEEEEKCRCLKKDRGSCVVCAGSGIIPAGLVEQRWAVPKEFNPNSHIQVKRLIRHLKHPVPKHVKKLDERGEAAETTEMKELEKLAAKTKHPIYPLLIEKRQLTKTEGTYVEGWSPSSDGAIHTTYTFQTATWQTSSRSPNVQNGLKHGKTEFQKALAAGFNAMQRAQSGRVLVNLDFKSFHALTTAHDFNIPDYARLARIDIHSFITCHFMKRPERDRLWAMSDAEMGAHFKELKRDDTFKFTRDFKAKRAILGIQFGMGWRKLYQLNSDEFENEREARTVWEMVYHLFPSLGKAQDGVRQKAGQDKRLINKFMGIRHFFDVTRWDRKKQKYVPGEQAEEAVAFLPASHAFGHVRECLLEIRDRGLDAKYGLVNSVHDSFLFHCPLELKDECVKEIKGIMETPSKVLIYPKMAPLGFQVDADATTGESMFSLQ